MSDIDDFDPTDETLAHGLRSLAPSEFDLDADVALGSMRPALHRARARRRLAMSSSALGVVVVLAAGVVVLRPEPNSRVDIRGGSGPTVASSTSTSPPPTKPTTSTTKPRVVVPPTTPNQATTTTEPGDDNGGSTPASTPTSGGSTPTTDDRGGSTPTTPTTVAAPVTKTYSSPGGKVTVRFANGRLTLVSHPATAGYTAEVHTNKPDDVEVRFSNGDAESQIRVRVQAGQLRPEITEH